MLLSTVSVAIGVLIMTIDGPHEKVSLLYGLPLSFHYHSSFIFIEHSCSYTECRVSVNWLRILIYS